MAKWTKFVCDRCDAVKEWPHRPETAPPEGWSYAGAKILCGDCNQDLDSFLRGARIEHIAVDRKLAPE